MSDEAKPAHKHRYRIVRPGNVWGCTQGEHNYIERGGFRQAFVMCYDRDAPCAQGWCVDCIPLAADTRREG